jgi:ABC-type glutathione transport system ATPase component
MILGLRGTGARISSGQIMIDQRDISGLGRTAMAPVRRKQLFYFSSDLQSQLNPELTVYRYLCDLITLSNRSMMYGNEANWDPVFYLVGIVDPEEILQKKCGDLKPLTVLRVMLISAVFVGAKVIMADDPAAQLDDLDRETFYQNLQSVARERKLAVLLSSGHFQGINRIADRIHIMFQGRILESGTPGELMKQPRFAYTRHYIQCHPDLREKKNRLPYPDDEAISEAEQSISGK